MSEAIYIGKKLKEARMRRLLTQEELAEKAGVSPSTIVNIERDQTIPHDPEAGTCVGCGPYLAFRSVAKLA